MKLLRLKLVNPTNPEADTIVSIDPRTIEMILDATSVDKRQRPEISCIIYNRYGSYAVREKMEFLEKAVEEANKDKSFE